ncbi:MAG: RNA 2',3'-cyclic phosphodiesterase [Proteobacteria bacterium]|nr:RNA 2',3'-cyclic phosphodiesterase [Pseudomonadota bacterium]
MAKIRTFIALELPEDLRNTLSLLQQRLRDQIDCVRWVKPEHIHLTLQFLGSIDEDQVGPISRILENVSHGIAPFTMHVAGIGAFPNTRNPKVIWAGMQTVEDDLNRFQMSIEDSLATIGFPGEKRPYAPHLTLGRVKESRGKKMLGEVIEQFKHEDGGSFTADTVVFFKSDLLPTGPVYSALKTIRL